MINSLPYSGIQPFSYEPKKENSYIKSRKRLSVLIRDYYNGLPEEKKKIHPTWLCNELFDFWSKPTVNGKETIWDREEKKQKRLGRKMSIGGRMATCAKIHQYDKRWKESAPAKKKVYRPSRLKAGQMAVIDHPIFEKKNFNLNE